ncbi:MAG: hypothetical protein COA45_03010 [Zetaproteobacteria bacterium]|nr:MAG: hypothetical protein COA45_03010 [Zetaproteobacteria bacterium]
MPHTSSKYGNGSFASAKVYFRDSVPQEVQNNIADALSNKFSKELFMIETSVNSIVKDIVPGSVLEIDVTSIPATALKEIRRISAINLSLNGYTPQNSSQTKPDNNADESTKDRFKIIFEQSASAYLSHKIFDFLDNIIDDPKGETQVTHTIDPHNNIEISMT